MARRRRTQQRLGLRLRSSARKVGHEASAECVWFTESFLLPVTTFGTSGLASRAREPAGEREGDQLFLRPDRGLLEKTEPRIGVLPLWLAALLAEYTCPLLVLVCSNRQGNAVRCSEASSRCKPASQSTCLRP